MKWIALSMLLIGPFGCGAPHQVDIPAADPNRAEARTLAGWATASMDALLGASAAYGAHSGYVGLFARDGRIAHAVAVGHADREADRAMTMDTKFRIASMTKPVTAVAAMILIEEGRLSLDDPVSRFVPKAANLRVARSTAFDARGEIETEPIARPLTVRDLLTFSSGIGSRGDDSDLGTLWAANDIYAGSGSLAERVDRTLSAPLYEQPGEQWRYGWSADVLARVVEVAADEPFAAFLHRRIFEPLGMEETSFLPPPEQRERLAAMYTQDEAGDLTRLDAPASDALDWTPGGSGLVSTASDYMRFALMLANGGEYAGARILAPETVSEMTRAHVPSGVLVEEGIEGMGWGLGLAVVVDSDATPLIDRDGDFWWSGYYGTTFFVSPETDLVGIVMTQNQPGPHSPRPYAIYLAPAFAFFGL